MASVLTGISIGQLGEIAPLAWSWPARADLLLLGLAAFLGGVAALFVAGPLRAALRRLWRPAARYLPGRLGAAARSLAGGSGVRGRFPVRCEQVGCGLEDFAREVEARLDSKLDRLEVLLKKADRILYGENAAAEDAAPDDPAARSCPAVGAGAAAEGDLRQITTDERARVIALAARGESVAAISQTVGLLRGEVDLILRLYGEKSPASN